jgi:membrane-bound lytic murein transglycosylase MltF
MDHTRKALILLLAIVACGCSRPTPPAKPATPAPSASLPPPAYEAALPQGMRSIVGKTFTGDLDQMVARRLIRIGAPFNRTFYFIDHGVQRGLAYDYIRLFEDELNKHRNTGALKVAVIVMPMQRDELIAQLRAGKIDAAVAQLTVTPERQKLVAFSNPTRTNVDEVLVTGPDAPQVHSLADLGRTKVLVRKSSSYFSSLEAYNARQKAAGRAQLVVEAAPESLEDDDLLEMVNAGLIPATVVDNYLAAFWKQVFPNMVVHDDLTLRSGGDLAVAYRKENPQLGAELNAFLAKNGLNTVFGRVLSQRYLQSTQYVKDANSEADRKRFLEMVDLFRKYGDEYNFDYLMMAAQGYQESGLKQDAKSAVGSVGVMQLQPKTGDELDVGDIRQIGPNIHAGVKYMRFMRDRYFQGQPMDDLDKELFTFAAYNAGPRRIDLLRREAAERGLNPNVWFGNVEQVASERIGRETVTYVSNIYKYYIAYKLLEEQKRRRDAAKSTLVASAKR